MWNPSTKSDDLSRRGTKEYFALLTYLENIKNGTKT